MTAPPLALCIGAGILSALLYATAATGSAFSTLPVLLSPLPVFMVGLSQNARAAMISGITGTVALGIAGGPLAGAAYFLANALAPIQLCRLALMSRHYTGADGKPATEWYPTGMLLLWLTGLGIVLLLVSALVIQSFEGGLRQWISETAQVDALVSAIIQAQTQTGQTEFDKAELSDQLIRMALPAIGIFWLGLALVNGALAQRLLVRMGRNARPSPGLLFMHLPGITLLPVAAGLAMAMLPGDMGLTGMAVAVMGAVPYFFLGLATVHVISRRLPARTPGLATLYLILALYGWPCLVVAGLGVIEQFVGFRYRNGPQHKEN